MTTGRVSATGVAMGSLHGNGIFMGPMGVLWDLWLHEAGVLSWDPTLTCYTGLRYHISIMLGTTLWQATEHVGFKCRLSFSYSFSGFLSDSHLAEHRSLWILLKMTEYKNVTLASLKLSHINTFNLNEIDLRR